MRMEKNLNKMSNENQEQEVLSLRKILYVLKKRILLIILVTAIATLCGIGYLQIKKPTYTATQNVNYWATSSDSDIKEQSATEKQNNINAMRAYVDTVVDFCDEGIVLERADSIYADFLKSEKSVDDYVLEFRENPREVEKSGVRYFSKGAITASTKANAVSDGSTFMFKLSVNASSLEVARAKSRILVLAISLEAENAFGGVTTVIEETVTRSSDIPCSSSASKKRTLIVFFVIGLALSLFAVYISEVLDRTIQDKDEFEKITDTNVIAYIEKQEAE